MQKRQGPRLGWLELRLWESRLAVGGVGLALASGALWVGAAAAVAIPAIAAGAVGFVGYKVYGKLKDRTDRNK